MKCIFSEYSFDDRVKGLDFYHFINKTDNYSKHFHENQYMIAIVREGLAYTVESKKSESYLGPNCIGFINPGFVHSGIIDSEKGLTYSIIHVDKKYFSTNFLGYHINGDIEFTKFTVRGNLVLIKLLSQLCDIFLKKESSLLEKETSLIGALQFLVGNCSNKKKKFNHKKTSGHYLVKKAKELLSENFSEDVSISSIASNLGITKGHFHRIFIKMTGISPALYRNILRIDRAKTLLQRKSKISDVAVNLGFVDQSHLTRVFKKIKAITPKKILVM